MGGIAVRDADLPIVTSDNPRTEDPERILDDIEAGMGDAARTCASWTAPSPSPAPSSIARPDDTVLLAGKGHETYQVVGTEKLPLDERVIVQGDRRGRDGVTPSGPVRAGGGRRARPPARRPRPRLRRRVHRHPRAGRAICTSRSGRAVRRPRLPRRRARAGAGRSSATTRRRGRLTWFEVDDTLVAYGRLARARRAMPSGARGRGDRHQRQDQHQGARRPRPRRAARAPRRPEPQQPRRRAADAPGRAGGQRRGVECGANQRGELAQMREMVRPRRRRHQRGRRAPRGVRRARAGAAGEAVARPGGAAGGRRPGPPLWPTPRRRARRS